MASSEQNEGKAKRTSKDLIASAESVIAKAKAEAFQNKAKDLLQKRATAQATVDGLDAELEAAAEAYDASN